jgi:FKBP-type peptidyl-prolyl cis-trans isomerase 2
VVGDGTVITALDDAVQGMRQGGVRQIIVPEAYGYPKTDMPHDVVGPKPTTFSGMRALNFVLENNQGTLDKTLLINVQIVRVDAPNGSGKKGF